MPEERKLATILFADIVGSTAAGSAHDPEVVRRTLGRTFAEMREILEGHGGTVEKFIGDAVMAIFGVPAAHDDDADRAVRAAFALRARVQELTAAGRIPLELRIGVNTGQVVAGVEGETLVTGAAVNEAARLQQAANPGDIVVGALTQRLTAGGVRYGPARTVAAKGIGELAAHPAEALTTAVPEQHRGIAGLQAPLVGRDEELRLLVDSFRKTATDRRAALITIFGSAGVGKSRLVREFVDAIGPERVRRGRCLPYGEGITFWPITEVLRSDAQITAADTRERARSKLRAAALTAFGEASADADAVARRLTVLAGLASPDELLPEIGGEQLQQELRVAFRRYLERRADRQPLLLVFDDIHWAEPPLLDLIEHLAEWSRAPLFLVCIARPELRDRRRGWGGGLMNASAIVLDPLSPEESRRLVADLLDIDDLPEELRAQVVARAEGNPLYLEEFLRMLIDAGHIGRRGGRWVAAASIADLVVPPTLQGLIAARLDQAPPDVKRTLQHAAVIGKVFWTSALTALDGRGSVDDALLEAARREIVIELDERGPGGGATYQFRHILIRDVAYDSIPKEQRVHLHDGFGRWLEGAAGERIEEYADIVAYHAEQAFRHADELGEPDAEALGARALGLLLAAGRKAVIRSDLRGQISFYSRAAGVASRINAVASDLAEATLYMATARDAAESTSETTEQLRRAIGEHRAAGPSPALVRALLQLAYRTVQLSAEAEAEAVTMLDDALAVAGDTADHELIAEAMTVRATIHWWRGELDEHRHRLEEALAYEREHGMQRALSETLSWLGANAAVQAQYERALSFRRQFVELAERSGSLLHLRQAKQGEVRIAISNDRTADAVRAAHEAIAVSQQLGSRELLGRAYELLGDALFYAGDLEASRDAFLDGLRAYDPSQRASLPETQWRLARTYLALGDIGRARDQAEAGRASVVASDVFSVATTTAQLAAVRSAEGALVDAEDLFREALENLRGTGYRAALGEIELVYADHLIAGGRAAEAREALQRASVIFSDPLAARVRREIEERLRKLEPATA
ncbi:MAG TPA: adenylate/guanylate cyclase domain-containing protein [Candidatus Limnocylindria bacterium]